MKKIFFVMLAVFYFGNFCYATTIKNDNQSSSALTFPAPETGISAKTSTGSNGSASPSGSFSFPAPNSGLNTNKVGEKTSASTSTASKPVKKSEYKPLVAPATVNNNVQSGFVGLKSQASGSSMAASTVKGGSATLVQGNSKTSSKTAKKK